MGQVGWVQVMVRTEHAIMTQCPVIPSLWNRAASLGGTGGKREGRGGRRN